jgi:hypothetical protein
MLNRIFPISVFVLSLFSLINDSVALTIDEQETTVTVSESYVSRYIWRGQDLHRNNDPAHQPSIDISVPQAFNNIGMSFNILGSFPLNNGHEGAEELDYTISFFNDISEDFNLSFGYTYFDFPNANSQSDVQESWISVALNEFPELPIAVSVVLFAGYDFKATSNGPDEGWYYSWGLNTELSLPKLLFLQEEQTISLEIVNWGNDGVANLKSESLYATEFSVSTSYSFDAFEVTPSLNYTINYEDEINNGDEEFWSGIQISYAF